MDAVVTAADASLDRNVIAEPPRSRVTLVGLLVIMLIGSVYLPSLGTYLQADDFEWLNSTYSAWHSPAQLLSPISGFFRPVVKLSYLLDYTVFATDSMYYNLTNLFLHLAAVLLLYLWLCRVTGRLTQAAMTSLLFGISAAYSEVTLWSAARMESMLLGLFLGVLLMLERGGDDSPGGERRSWSWHASVLAMALLAAGTKETWVVLPVLATAWLLLRGTRLRAILCQTAGLWSLLLVYLGYFVVRPVLTGGVSPTAYGQSGLLHMLQKAGFLLMKYVGLGELATGTLAQLLVVALVLSAVGLRLARSGNRLGVFGLVWVLMTIGISLPVFYAPSRYNYLPLAGFWIMVVAWVDHEIRVFGQRFPGRQSGVVVLAGAAIISYAVYNVIMLQWEIRDYRLRGQLHKVLADSYLQVRDQLPTGSSILFLDVGQRRAVEETQRAILGYRKLLMTRKDAIWQLVRLAPLANFLRAPGDRLLQPVEGAELAESLYGEVVTLIFSDSRGFTIAVDDSSLAEMRAYYRSHGRLPFKVELLRERTP